MVKKKIFIISSRFPYPLEKGDKLRLYHQMRILASTYDLVSVSITSEDPIPNDIKEIEKLCSSVYYFKLPILSRFVNMIFGLFKQKPFQVSYFYSAQIKRKIDQLIINEKPDFLYCQLMRSTEYGRNQIILKVVDYMDAFSWGMDKRAKNSNLLHRLFYKFEAMLLRKYEARIFDEFNAHTIISEQDRDRMSLTRKDDIIIVPNGVNVDYFQGNDKLEKNAQICFIGNLGYLPNVKAVEFLAKSIMPIVNEQNDDFKLLIAGARPSLSLKKLENKSIEIRGWVDDIRDAYNDAKIFVAPLFVGIGQQNKILEAMSMGLPCITSIEVNNSIGAEPGKSILIARTAQEFVDAINYLLNNSDKYEEIKSNAKRFVQENYGWETQSKKLFDIFAE